MLTSFGFYDLIETFPQPGCAICNLLRRDVTRLLDSTLYEFVVDRTTHKEFRASRGFCNEHGWQLLKLGNGLGIATLYEAALDEVLSIMEQTAPAGNNGNRLSRMLFNQGSGSGLASALEPDGECAACKMQAISEADYTQILGEHIRDERLQSAFRDSEGVCLPHFRLVLQNVPDAERLKLLVNIQRSIWRRLQIELQEFMRKSDFHNVAESMGEEGDSWRRIVARLGGEAGIFGLRR